MSNPGETQPPPNMPHVTPRLPTFISTDPELWFLQIDSFLPGALSEQERYSHIMAALPHTTVQRIRDAFPLFTASTTPYTLLKQTLIARLAPSQEDRLHQLLANESLGDRLPTEMMTRMLALIGSNPTTREVSIIKQLFMKKLPQEIQAVLAIVDPNLPLQTLAEAADRVIKLKAPTISAVIPASRPPSPTHAPSTSFSRLPDHSSQSLEHRMSALEVQMANMARDLKTLVASTAYSTHPRNQIQRRNSSRGRSPSPGRRTFPNGNCYYHHTYGEQANKCSQPCKWTENCQASLR